jgi:hypothetical protein
MKISHIEQSIIKAHRYDSKLTKPAREVPSFTGQKIRHLLNNLGNMPDIHYLEIGVHKGGTFVATNFRNKLSSSVAVDNWSEFAEGGFSREEFLRYTQELLPHDSFRFLEKDCWTLTREDLPHPVNMYFYDGNHSVESQEKALVELYPLLADEFIYMVDDWSWPDPNRGTRNGLNKMNFKVLYEREMFTPEGHEPGEHWWNGFYVALLNK